MIQRDFKFIARLINEFTSQEYIIKKLNIIHDNKLTGWEIWFQIEFAIFLNNHNEIRSWKREVSFKQDRRIIRYGNKVIIDFLIQKKYSNDMKNISLELKQHLSMQTCMKKMIEDGYKIETILKSDGNFRSNWNIGIHKRPKKHINKIYSEYDFCYKDNCRITQDIKETNFAYTIF